MYPAAKTTLTVVTASNLNPDYLDCIPMFIEFWQIQKLNENFLVHPLVYLIADCLPSPLEKYREFIVTLPPSDFDSAFIAQNIRTLVASQQTTDYVMTTDVDMFPMSNKVTDAGLQALEADNSRFVICRDVLPIGQFPICYNIASPATWLKVFPNSESMEQVFTQLSALMEQAQTREGYSGIHGGAGWFTDQEFLFNQVTSNLPKSQVVRLRDEQTKHRRLDRLHLKYFLKWLVLPFVLAGLYSDYHIHFPVKKNTRYLKTLRCILLLRKKLGK
jgi:hypothetical protein